MSEKQLRSMDKIQLLSILRQQELEIQRLTTERDIEIQRATADKEREIQRLTADKEFELQRLTAEKGLEIQKATADLEFEIQRLNSERETDIQNAIADIELDIQRFPAEVNSDFQKINADMELEIRRLTAENEALAKRAGEQSAVADESGSTSVSGIMQSAQEAANIYLSNIRRLEAEQLETVGKIEEEAKENAALIIRAAELKRAELEEDVRAKTAALVRDAELKKEKTEHEAREYAAAIIKEAEQKRDEIEYNKRRAVEDLRIVSQMYIEFIDKAHSGLHEMIQGFKLTQLPPVTEPIRQFHFQPYQSAQQTQHPKTNEQPLQTGDNV